jgi:hypothetical protein
MLLFFTVWWNEAAMPVVVVQVSNFRESIIKKIYILDELLKLPMRPIANAE